MRRSRPGVAIVGAGLMGQWHAAAARQAGARVLAIVDPDAVAGQRLASRFGAVVLPSIERLIETAVQPTVAHVCTPAASHVDLVHQLFERRLHVVCEKPLAPDAGSVTRLYTLAAQAARQLCPVHQFTTQRGFTQALARLPEIGELRRIAFVFHSPGIGDRSSQAKSAKACFGCSRASNDSGCGRISATSESCISTGWPVPPAE